MSILFAEHDYVSLNKNFHCSIQPPPGDVWGGIFKGVASVLWAVPPSDRGAMSARPHVLGSTRPQAGSALIIQLSQKGQ